MTIIKCHKVPIVAQAFTKVDALPTLTNRQIVVASLHDPRHALACKQGLQAASMGILHLEYCRSFGHLCAAAGSWGSIHSEDAEGACRGVIAWAWSLQNGLSQHPLHEAAAHACDQSGIV